MDGIVKSRSWMRRNAWWLLGIGLLIFISLTSGTPAWYSEEEAAMEDIARLIKAPVPYLRWGSSDFGWNPPRHISAVYLPAVHLDKKMIRRLAELIRELPRDEVTVVCYYVWDQPESVAQLKKDLAEHAYVLRGPGAYSEGRRELQEVTYVAGIHRPGTLPLD